MLLNHQRQAVVDYSKQLTTRKLVRGTGGNISIIDRAQNLVAITPSGLDYEKMTAADITVVDLQGNIIEGHRKPSSELALHLCCYRSREDAQAVVHTHSTYATILACMNRDLAPIHYLIGYGGGDCVPCLPYRTFGTTELANQVGDYFGAHPTQRGLLMGNHGLIALGNTLHFAFDAAEELEFVSEIYYKTLLLGGGNLLDRQEMAIVNERFKSYGQKPAK